MYIVCTHNNNISGKQCYFCDQNYFYNTLTNIYMYYMYNVHMPVIFHSSPYKHTSPLPPRTKKEHKKTISVLLDFLFLQNGNLHSVSRFTV